MSTKLGQPVSKQYISRWLSQCITLTYEILGKDPPTEVSGHSTRSMGASMADIAGVPMLDIYKAADWKSRYVFAKHYRLNFADKSSADSNKILKHALTK